MMKKEIHKAEPRLNGICPYFTMFPYDFPHSIINEFGTYARVIMDPFCGRGTTNIAARMHGIHTVGFDVNRLAVAITKAKMVTTDTKKIISEFKEIRKKSVAVELPEGEFWKLAFERKTLAELIKLRFLLNKNTDNPERIALRAIVAGALHGPINKGRPSYLSNQSPRTFAPKPGYAVRFWKRHSLYPPAVDIEEVVVKRTLWYFSNTLPKVESTIIQKDSRSLNEELDHTEYADLIITSPPYWSMKTYRSDQWLRLWFLGESEHITYSEPDAIGGGSVDEFILDLQKVWKHVADFSKWNAKLIVRFGSIPSAPTNNDELIERSLIKSGWKLSDIRLAGHPGNGKRQIENFGSRKSKPKEEKDYICVKENYI